MMYIIEVTPAFHGHNRAAIQHHNLQVTTVEVVGIYGDEVDGDFVPAGPGIDEYRETISGDDWAVFQERTTARDRPTTKAESEFDNADMKDFLENHADVLVRVEEIRTARSEKAEADAAAAAAKIEAVNAKRLAAVEAEKVELLAARKAERDAAAEAAGSAVGEAEANPQDEGEDDDPAA